MNTLPFPSEEAVERAADVVWGFLARDPNLGLPSKQKCVSLARLILRTGFLSPNGNSSEHLRWCFRCHKQTPTEYRDIGFRCVTCGKATVNLDPQRQLS